MQDPLVRLNEALSGRYEIERELGQGGMATVYLAEDLKHRRRVALKVLKPELAAVVGASRFLAEIETTASLQHPHILPLHDSGEADGLLFYVMPHVEGESLRDRLDREHQLPVDEAVRIATNVAEALDYAHRHGVIHRDIKPANILLQDGKPVVADFGIALAVSAGGGGRLTETGLSLGTPHYMSPEQATGDVSVGPATDIWALGCVLYEMLVGEPPYTGSTPQAVLGRIITAEADPVAEHRKAAPPHVTAAVGRALEKVPADRFGSALDFARALADSGFRHGTLDAARPSASRIGGWAQLGFAAAVGAALAVAVVSMTSQEPVASVQRFEVMLPAGLEFPAIGPAIDLSANGQVLVVVGESANGSTQLWQRPTGGLTFQPIRGTEGTTTSSFSPDGALVAFRVGGAIRIVSLLGDRPHTVLDVGAGRTVKWARDGWIYFGNASGGISRISADGGEAEVVTVRAEGETTHYDPEPLPRGKGLLFARRTGDGIDDEVMLASFSTGQTRVLFGGVSAVYTSSGHVVFASRDGNLSAVPFDIDRLEVTGPPVLVLEGVRTPSTGPSQFALSDGGVLVYVPGGPLAGGRQLTWVDRAGAEATVDPAVPPLPYEGGSVALSPDGRRLAVSLPSDDDPGDIWVKDLPSGPSTRLTTSPGMDRRPVWLRDGRTIAYIHNDVGSVADVHVRSVRADGGAEGAFDTLLHRDRSVFEMSFSADGRLAVFREGGATIDGDIGYLDLATGAVEERVVESDFLEKGIALSRDGRWLAYVSDVTGADEVYVRPFPRTEERRITVSLRGGVQPVWAHNGRELFFREPTSGWMIAASYTTDPEFGVVDRARLFDASPYASTTDNSWRSYDVGADDQRFVMIRRSLADHAAPGLILVQNVFEELRQRVPN